MKFAFLPIVLVFIFTCCNEYTPKPMGYARIERKENEMVRFERAEFSFLYSSEAKIEYLKPDADHEIWFNIYYPAYQAKIYCTYITTDKKGLPKMFDDSHQLAYSHAVMAKSISQTQYSDTFSHSAGLIYDIEGSVASPIQFYITNNSSKFLRGALYFDNVVKSDSVAPVVAFLRHDIVNMMQSLEWSKKEE